jgi:hypothetical protein
MIFLSFKSIVKNKLDSKNRILCERLSGFAPTPPKKIEASSFVLFLSKPQAWHIITARKRGAYHQGRLANLVSHHALACMPLQLDEIHANA